ncbi:PEP-utilizing enzyme [Desertibacillus haloalkaliphilus]|uniref:PEP-utilizing enzyme n=1 Tax=Desertibacillus haloalkaliphilus TaxID=1328930 RepID=UPI001C26E19C|nr:PEP-utilizing enzyme [Desertibacillus haloalkaliphilus]MBU8908725.1 PEP-utilizing protein [Desertibacillus haloalkaliphilus]
MSILISGEEFKDFKTNLFIAEEEKNLFWQLDGAHFQKPLTPLFSSYIAPAVSAGTLEAFEKLKLPVKQFRVKMAKGYYYQTVPLHDNVEERLKEHQEAMTSVFPRLMEIFNEYVEETILPFYERLDEYQKQNLTLQEAEQKVIELDNMYKRIWSIHFEVVMPRLSMGVAIEEVYGELLNTKNTAEVYDLLLGTMNKSLETDRELWKLSLLVKGSSVLTKIFNTTNAEQLQATLEEVEEGRKFLDSVQSFLDVYGYRTANSHEFADETWIENPFHALKVIKNYLEKDFDFEAELQEVISKREKKVGEALSKMPEGELKEQFKSLHEMALKMWGIDEDHHFYIDAMLPAKARPFLLNVGQTLVKHSVIEQKEDVVFLYLDELVEVLRNPKPSHDLIKERKEEHKYNESLTPAPFFGEPPEGPVDPIVERVFGSKTNEISEEMKSFSGYAGSQGKHTGTVKVVSGQHEFDKVKKGDILVCKTTTPPWTVLFNLAGAIVTDVGGILSHAATVAREYEVPCVIGTKVATSTLKDGDVITVDGTKGEVIIHEQN